MNSGEKFLKDLKRQNPKALDYFIDNYSNLIFKIANGVLNNRELSKECLNDVILKVWNNIDNFHKSISEFNVWVMAITKYTAIDILRKEKRHYNIEDITGINVVNNENLENKVLDNECLDLIRKEINNMNATDKEIFLKKFFQGKNSKEIGKELGVTEKFINLRIFRGRKKLKEKLERG